MTYSTFEFFVYDIEEESYFLWYKVVINIHGVFETYVTLSRNVTYFSRPGDGVMIGRPPVHTGTCTCSSKSLN